MAAICEGPECTKEAARDGLCWGHLKQLERKGRLSPLRAARPGGREGVEELAVALGNVETGEDGDEAFRLARRRFWAAVDGLVMDKVREILEAGLARTRGSTPGRRMRR